MVRPQQIDDLTREQYWYLTPEDQCFYFYEYTPGAGYQHSDANKFIFNFKKPVSRKGLSDYKYKGQAIDRAIQLLRQAFGGQKPEFWTGTTFVPVPPSKAPDHSEYDDRLFQLVRGICANTGGEARELIRQNTSYQASHAQSDGARIKPGELTGLYSFDSDAPPRSLVVLIDDVLTTGCHFRVAKDMIIKRWPSTDVFGFFLARVARPDPADAFPDETS